ncbi:hypothetical protein [Streptomyces brasiliensis]|uniref:Uncharacterized protein n=1 Tax=Streptomyces brasiliensis TaxID=1954 RepID=A0A917NSC1_9ACTN|nr:hypothetical protein [Streptomyces brasiliensis]GGJ24206.1 hypothetical protein GCM10010121_039070 [Streptomyces brasiliensis]
MPNMLQGPKRSARHAGERASTGNRRKGLVWMAVGLTAGAVAVTTGFQLGGSEGSSGDGVTVHKARKTVPDLSKYWTPERMRNAIPE